VSDSFSERIDALAAELKADAVAKEEEKKKAGAEKDAARKKLDAALARWASFFEPTVAEAVAEANEKLKDYNYQFDVTNATLLGNVPKLHISRVPIQLAEQGLTLSDKLSAALNKDGDVEFSAYGHTSVATVPLREDSETAIRECIAEFVEWVVRRRPASS
jgi:hypothetical protein